MKHDKELEEFRKLMTPPTTFQQGFSFSSLAAAIFVGLIMIPGSLYMELLAGQGVGAAAQWVTVILFIEVAKRANSALSRAQIFVLFYMAGAIASQSVAGTPLFQQFLVRSEAAISSGLAPHFPNWVAPSDPEAYATRSFFTAAWLPAIGLIAFRMFFSRIDNAVLSYGLFRQVSDVERLPFPMAPVGAQGMMALADNLEDKHDEETAWRWRSFSIGGALGLVFGFLYMGWPTLTASMFGTPSQIFPIPFFDATSNTQDILPAVATGLSFDLGNIILGMVMPFFAVIGSFVGVVILIIANPILYYSGILTGWQRDMKTVETLFRNSIDVYMSFTIGLSLAVATVGFWAFFKMAKTVKKAQDVELQTVPKGRGDIPNPLIICVYFVSTSIYITMSSFLIGWDNPQLWRVLLVLAFYAYFYTPLISYVTARMEGLAGQIVEIPFIREISFILSGYKGLEIWFIPIPKANYGTGVVYYRQAELTGTKFTSMWKADVFLFPIILISMLLFSSFIWSLGEVPSAMYPYAHEIWEFEAKNQALILGSTMGEYTEFRDALTIQKVGIGYGVGLALYMILGWFGTPVMLFYGLIKGLSGMMMHGLIPQFIGACLGHFYFRKKIGPMWKKFIVVTCAGFFCGSGLIAMFCIGIRFLVGATASMPY